ncbi:hypothetical protein CRM22_009805 [Opisthorchis felineus]|uniref:Uncharacterized protein n=1 Tax=Opisthorchis felineus TaxID=147828 RepID=A0A4S2LBH2_OPIFE|nr:hypothetical protein CRM22_009805 [Opisthorchis felineus]
MTIILIKQSIAEQELCSRSPLKATSCVPTLLPSKQCSYCICPYLLVGLGMCFMARPTVSFRKACLSSGHLRLPSCVDFLVERGHLTLKIHFWAYWLDPA